MPMPEQPAASEYGPTPEELEERIFSILRRYPVEPDDVREVGGAVETLVEYANRSPTEALPK